VSVIKSLGGKPVPECEYDFGITNVASAVRTAKVLENTGVSAYDGAIAYIDRRALQTAGATIATMQALTPGASTLRCVLSPCRVTASIWAVTLRLCRGRAERAWHS
jgi:hypothetical protein